MIPQRCCPAWAMLRAISERVETHPLLRLSLAVLTVGSLLTIAIVNLVGASGGEGGPRQGPQARACFLGGRNGNPQILDPCNFGAYKLPLVH